MSSVSSVRSGMSSNHQSNSQTNKRGRKESIVWEHFFKETIGDGHSLPNVIIVQKLGLEGNLNF